MFITEKDLVNALKLHFDPICDWNPKTTATAVLEEVNVGFGIADLVITKLKQVEATHNRLTYFDIVIYKIIENNSEATLEYIKSITKAGKSTIQKSINKLIIESFINKKDSFFTVKQSYRLISEESIAIEAKLKDWKRALYQAFRYKWFSSQSFVVLDSKYVRPAIKNLEEFKKLNVGLAEISSCGKIIIHHKPTVTKPIDDKMSMLLNEHIKHHLVSK